MALSGCVTVQDADVCTALPRVSNGGGCAHLLSGSTFTLSQTELLDLLDTQPAARTCVPKGDLPVCADDQTTGTPVTLPARGPSVIMLDAQWNQMKTTLEEACRELGNGCEYAQPMRDLMREIEAPHGGRR